MNQKEEEIVKLKHVQTPNSTAVQVTTVLEFISHNSCTDYGAKLVSEDGQDVDVPLQILCLAWPGLKNLVPAKQNDTASAGINVYWHDF